MAAPVKKRAVNLNENESSGEKKADSGSSGDESSPEETDKYEGQAEIQVEFEGRNPIDSDFHGIKQLLHQLFLKAHLNLSELTNLIIGQSYVGSVVKQSVPDEEESEDDDDDSNDVFGITTVVNVTEKQKLECISQLRSLLLELSIEHGSDETVNLVRSLLSSDQPVGLLINERFVNIPSQIVVPLLKSLSSEIKRAVEKKMAFDFSYLILICKLYKLDPTAKKSKKSKKTSEPEIVWSNPEEEIIDQEADLKFEFSVKNDSDSGLSGQWHEDDSALHPFRRVLLIKAEKLDTIVNKLEEELNH